MQSALLRNFTNADYRLEHPAVIGKAICRLCGALKLLEPESALVNPTIGLCVCLSAAAWADMSVQVSFRCVCTLDCTSVSCAAFLLPLLGLVLPPVSHALHRWCPRGDHCTACAWVLPCYSGRHQVQPAAASAFQFRKQLRSEVKTSAQSSNAANNSDWSSKPADENASTSQPSADSSSAPQREPQENSMLAIPLLIGSSLSHINKQYIKMRRRRKWWSKMGGYPKVSMSCIPQS